MNILTIGNSFTDSLALYFPAAVQSARCDLHFERANFGGCELARHWSYIEAEERDVRCRIYQGGRKLRSILELRACWMWSPSSRPATTAGGRKPSSPGPETSSLM